MDGSGLITKVGDIIELAGLGAVERGVQALSAAGVAVYISKNSNEMSIEVKTLHAAGLGAYSASSSTPFFFIHLSIFSSSTTFSRTLKVSSALFFSISLLRCLFRTIAFISFGLTFLSLPHWVKRVLYCRILQELVQVS
jgi:hypothetical protein